MESGNASFSLSVLTILALALFAVIMPAIHIMYGGTDTTELLRDATRTMHMIILVGTILILWVLFGVTWAATIMENTGLKGIGFRRIRLIDFVWAGAFFLGALVILYSLYEILSWAGFEIPGEVELLIPRDLQGKLVWAVVSFTAGFCEEAIFRGYLMTRIRLLGKFSSWTVPVILSALIFGSLHGYEGVAGVTLITIYGALLSLLYIRTRSIWPCVIAHFFQDLQYVFLPPT